MPTNAQGEEVNAQGMTVAQMNAVPATPTNPSIVPTPDAAFPNDPATLSGARANPLYLGPTNFSTIQKQFTPYQIEQSTTRDSSGNIFWKQGVDISKIPASAPSSTFAAPTTLATPSTNNLPSSTITPDVNVTKQPSAMDAFAQAQSQASEAYLKGIQGSIDGLLAKQQQMQTAAKEAAATEQSGLKSRLTDIMNGGSSRAESTLQATRAMFKVQDSINTLQTIQGKISDATNALNQGLIYEESQPVRMALLTGRSSELKKQGIATIGALQSAAEVVKGNIDLAQSYASDTIAAIKQDNSEKTAALNTLLDLANSNLVQLSKEEKDTIEQRTQLLKDESKRLDDQKSQLMDLATKYPQAFSAGGVTFTDDPQKALAKMIPTMSAQEKQLYDLDIQTKIQAIAASKAAAARAASGSGSGSTSPLNGSFDADKLAYINYLFSQNTPLKDVIDQLGGPTVLNTKQLNALQDAWTTYAKPVAPVTASDLVNNYGIDPTKEPQYIGMTPAELQAALIKKNQDSAATATHGIGASIKNAWDTSAFSPKTWWNNLTK